MKKGLGEGECYCTDDAFCHHHAERPRIVAELGDPDDPSYRSRRNAAIYRLRKEGYSYRVIGELVGVTKERARDTWEAESLSHYRAALQSIAKSQTLSAAKQIAREALN